MFTRFVRRSWGWYLVLFDYKYFKVKLLRFKVGGKLSKQYHGKRSEFWLFLSGMGNLIVDSNCKVIAEGEYFNIPATSVHTFHALFTTYILEIQYGSRCSEDDIVRLN